MSTMRPVPAKIISHAEGLGTVSIDIVRSRAEEIATINGHRKYTEEDWRQARQELHGGHESTSSDGQREMSDWVSEADMIASDTGHQSARLGMEDEGNIVEELVAEGMDEAVHEQMLLATMEDREEEGED